MSEQRTSKERIAQILERLDYCADSDHIYFEISPETSRELRDYIRRLAPAPPDPGCRYNGPCDYKYGVAVPPAAAPCAECQRMREGLQLIATDEHRLMNVTARNTAQSILNGKPSGVTPEPPTAAFERGCYVLMEMMKAYERRIRSDCATQEEIDLRPWECAEYVAAAEYLRKVWPPRAAPPPDDALDYLRRAMDFYVANHTGLSTLMEAVDKVCGPFPTKSAVCPACRGTKEVHGGFPCDVCGPAVETSGATSGEGT